MNGMAAPARRSQGGYILMIVPLIIVAIVLLGYRMISRSRTSMRISSSDLSYLKTKLCSQQCVSLSANRIQRSLEADEAIHPGETTCTCKSQEDSGSRCLTSITEVQQKTSQMCYGYSTKLTQVSVSSECAGENAKNASLSEVVGYGEIPVFQFAIFYDGRLTLSNSPPMEVKGLVHSNDSIFIGTGSSLSFTDWVTTPKTIQVWDRVIDGNYGKVHFAKMDGTGSDPVPVLLTPVAFTDLDQLVSGWPAWKKQHRVAYQGQANGCGEVRSITVPIKNVKDNFELIEWRKDSDDDSRIKQKYAWKAELVYKNGWLDRNLQNVSFASDPVKIPAVPGGWATESIGGADRVLIYENREGYLAKLIPIDVDLLQQRNASDSIIYLYDQLTDPALPGKVIGGFLLYNGQRLIRPLTIATNTTMMVLGNYNVDSGYVFGGSRFPFPAALINDNITILSTDILPSEHAVPLFHGGTSILSRHANARFDLNACIMTGNSFNPALGGYYCNHENLIRLLEDWSGATFGFSGSAVALWNSRISAKAFTGHFYRPPFRDFSFSKLYSDLNNLPPGTPRLVVPGLLDWDLVRK